MKDRLQLGFLVLVGIAAFFFLFLPSMVDSRLNAVQRPEVPPKASERAQAILDGLRVADLHADSLLWNRNLLRGNRRGHVDVPRLVAGNVTLQAFTVVTKVPWGLNVESNPSDSDSIRLLAFAQRWPRETWQSLFERARFQAQKLAGFVARSGGDLVWVRSKPELDLYLSRRAVFPTITAGFLGLEGAHALEGKIENVEKLYTLGYRMIGLTHFFDNEVGGSAHGRRKGGITDFGIAVLDRLERRRMIVDLAHASPALIDDVLARARRPVVVSHTGLRSLCDGTRNLSDAHARAIAEGGGLIGIGFWETATCGTDVASIARSIRGAIDLVGLDHVTIGSDFDGAVKTPIDTTGYPLLIDALLAEGLDEEQIGKVLGDNLIAFLAVNLPQSL